MSVRFYRAMVPWVVFAVASRAGGQSVTWAAALALVVAIAVACRPPDVGIALLEVIAVVLFAALSATAAVAGGAELQRFGRAIVACALTLFAAVSLILVPFVAPYMRDLVPPDKLGTPQFRRASYSVAAMWAVAFGCVAGSFWLAALIQAPLASTLFNWLVPAAVVIWTNGAASGRWEADFPEDGALGGGLVGW